MKKHVRSLPSKMDKGDFPHSDPPRLVMVCYIGWLWCGPDVSGIPSQPCDELIFLK